MTSVAPPAPVAAGPKRSRSAPSTCGRSSWSSAIALAAWPFVGSSSTWLTLTIAGLAMGMIIFIAASGLTLVFGLMDVLNFGHSLFIALGAYIATTIFGAMGGAAAAPSVASNLGVVAVAMLAAMALAGTMGLGFERVIVRPVYGQHLKQILVTIGGAIIGEELIKVVWGPAQIPLPPPEALRGSILIGDATVEKLRLVSVVVGLVVLAALLYTLNRTKIGLLIRAGVQDREMVESLGYRIRRLFVGVFAAGSALAGLGGVPVGNEPADRHPADRRPGQRAALHRHHHRRPRLDARLPVRRAAGRPDHELRRLSRAQAGDVLEHRPDGRGAALAAARALSGRQPMRADRC